MPITAKNYVFNAQNPNVPRISVDVNTATTEEITTAISEYDNAVLTYKTTYETMTENRDYIVDMLEKDACSDVGLASINKVDNTYTANIKADNYFNQAKRTANVSSISSDSAVNSIVDNMKVLKTELFNTDQEDSMNFLEGGNWETTQQFKPLTYDERAITVAAENFSAEESSPVNFINDVVNKIGTDRTFTAYQASSDLSGGECTAKYTLKYSAKELRWEIKDSQNTIIKVTKDIDGVIKWDSPVSPAL